MPRSKSRKNEVATRAKSKSPNKGGSSKPQSKPGTPKSPSARSPGKGKARSKSGKKGKKGKKKGKKAAAGDVPIEEVPEDLSMYGGCEGPNAMYVKLISSDGHEFIVKREHVNISGTLKAMLDGPGQFADDETAEVILREIPSHVLEKICMYFAYKILYTGSPTEIPEFPIPPECALELLMAANFFDC